jgi:L-lactate dehydrogenase
LGSDRADAVLNIIGGIVSAYKKTLDGSEHMVAFLLPDDLFGRSAEGRYTNSTKAITDPLADLARHLAGHERVLSSGTFLDTLRFRFHLARRLKVSPAFVEAQVVGEHGTSQVFLWSSARVAGMLAIAALGRHGESSDEFRRQVEDEVRYANITIIEGTGASQLGIGMATARIVEAILRDEQAVIPIGAFNPKYGTTLSLPSVLGRAGVSRILEPDMSEDELQGLKRSAGRLRDALARLTV